MMEPSDLVDAIIEKLSVEMADQVRSVQLIPHEGKMKFHSGFPAIGVMDGGDKMEPGKMQEGLKYHVYVVAFQQIFSDNPGDAVSGTEQKPGVMKLIEKAKGILKKELFDYFDIVKYSGSSPTNGYIKFKKDDRDITTKTCRLEYRKLETSEI